MPIYVANDEDRYLCAPLPPPLPSPPRPFSFLLSPHPRLSPSNLPSPSSCRSYCNSAMLKLLGRVMADVIGKTRLGFTKP
jgi:hypothetical protein